MLKEKELLSLYNVLNKLFYQYAEAGKNIYNKQRNPDVDNKDYKHFLELSLAIDLLTESSDSLLFEEISYPYYGAIDSLELRQLLDYLIVTYNLTEIPYIDFPKNSTKFINSTTQSVTSGNTDLPVGGGPGFFLTKNVSGNLLWDDIEEIICDFNLL